MYNHLKIREIQGYTLNNTIFTQMHLGMPSRVETDQSPLNVREITKKEGCPRPSSSGQMITESTPLAPFSVLEKTKQNNSHAKEWRNIF